MIKRLYLLMAFCSVFHLANAQDIHFSQYEYAPLNINPAHTGLFDGNYRVVGNYRSQWFDVLVAYRTVSLTFDAHLLPSLLGRDVWGAGITFNYDQAGDSQLSWLNIAISTAYTKSIGKHFFITGGVQLGLGNRRFRLDNLTFDDQFNGDVYDATIQSYDQTKLAGNTGFSYFDINAGLNLRYEKDRRTWVNLGGGAFHLTSPNQSFLGAEIPLPIRWNVLMNTSIQITKEFDLMPAAWYQLQQDYQEIVFGLDGRIHFNTAPGRQTALKIGVFYRWEDAIIARIGFEYQRFHFGLSYDINISGFVPATRYNGGYELSVQYIWGSVPQLPTIKTCPVF